MRDSKNSLIGSPLPDGVILGNYEIRGVLGQGGFGITYWAIDKQLGREVVLKEHFPQGMCKRSEDGASVLPINAQYRVFYERSLNSFCKEARIIAALNHPGVVHIHDLFQALGTAYIVMDYEDGVLLTTWLEEHGREINRVSKVLASLLDTLSYLHSIEVFHRDIKPANIIVKEGDVPVLLDFGAALDGLPERTITIMASPKFSPPEQYDSNGNIGPWSDLFALGRTMIVGLGERLREYPTRFRLSLQKATRLEIKERFQTAAQWQAYLRKPPAENRFLAVIAVLVLVVISLGAVWIFNGKDRLLTTPEASPPPVVEVSSPPADVTNAETEKEVPAKTDDDIAKTVPDNSTADEGKSEQSTAPIKEDISPQPMTPQVTHEPSTDSAVQADDQSYAPDTLVGLRLQIWGDELLQLNTSLRQLPLFAQFYIFRDYNNLADNWVKKDKPYYPEGLMAAELIQFKPDGRWSIPKGISGNYGYIKVSDTQGVVVFETLDEYDETSLFYFYLYFTEKGKGVAIAGDGGEYTLGNIAFELSTDNLDLVKRKIPESTYTLFPYLKDEALTKVVAPDAVAGRMVQFDASEAEYCTAYRMPRGLEGYEQQKFYVKNLADALQSRTRAWRRGGKLPMTEPISFTGMTSYVYLSEKGWYICDKHTEKRIKLEINRPDGKVDLFIMEFVKPGEGWAAYYGGGDKVIRNIKFHMELIPQKNHNDIAPNDFFKDVIKKLEQEEAELNKMEEEAKKNDSSAG